MTIRHDLGPFALVPEWLLTSVSGSAIKLWCRLWVYSGNGTHQAWPSHDTLASQMGCSDRQIRRVLDELEQAGALTIETRTGTSNLYTLHFNRPVDNSRKPDKNVRITQDKNVLPPRTPVSYEERQSEIDNQQHGQSDTPVQPHGPHGSLTLQQIRQLTNRLKPIDD